MKTTRITLFLLFACLSFSVHSQQVRKKDTSTKVGSAASMQSISFQSECIDLSNEANGKIRVLVDEKGNVIGSFEGLEDSKSHDYLDKQLIQIEKNEIPVSKLPGYRWLSDGRLLLFGNPPQSHRGGGIAIDIVNLQSGQSTGLIVYGSAVSSAPVVAKDGKVWFTTIHGEGDKHMSLLKLSPTNEISVEARLPILTPPIIRISPDGQKILCSGSQLGMIQPEYYLLSADGSKELQQITGLLQHNVWINNNEIFTTNGYAWHVINPQDKSSPVELKWFNSPLDFVNASVLLQGSGLILVGSRKVNSSNNERKDASLESKVLFIDPVSGNESELSVVCPLFEPALLNTQGFQDNNMPWFGTDEVLVKLLN